MDTTDITDLELLKKHVEEARHTVIVARSALLKAEEALEELIGVYSNTMVRQYGDSGLGEQYEH